MKQFKFLLVVFIFSSSLMTAQRSVNSYEYLIVPDRYDFQKSKDQYQVNSLVKFLFEKEGFTVFLSNEEFPDELKLNRCLALTAVLNDHSKLLNTKMNFDLVDCDNNVLFSTTEGRSKEKDYKEAYFACVRQTFEDVKELNYNYEPLEEVKDNQEIMVSSTNNTGSNSESTAVNSNTNVNKDSSTNVVVPLATVAVAVENKEPEPTQVQEKTEQVKVSSDVLYAQPNATGYQIVDATPKVIYKLLNTSLDNVFLLEGHSAIVYKVGEDWKVEYYENGKAVIKPLNLKFF